MAKLPLPPEQILESAMLVYLRGLGLHPAGQRGDGAGPLRLTAADHICVVS